MPATRRVLKRVEGRKAKGKLERMKAMKFSIHSWKSSAPPPTMARLYLLPVMVSRSTNFFGPSQHLFSPSVLQLLLRSSDITAAVHSIASRVVLSALFYLPQTTPSLVSPDLQIYERLNTKIQNIARELGAGSTTAMSKSLCMVVRALSMTGLDDVGYSSMSTFHV